MPDRRTHPDPALITEETAARISAPLADLNRNPDGPRDRQVLLGDAVAVLARKGGSALVRSEKDGYCGWVPEDACGPDHAVSHKVTARFTHAYEAADIKAPETTSLSFGAQLNALSETATFIETDRGFIPRQHVHKAEAQAEDPAAIAEIFLGTPYLWGGNSGFGIDCSGLIQAACLACGIFCPGDSDQQEDQLGKSLPPDANLRRNDLIFWRGHVALVVDTDRLIHANAGHMATVFEPISDAITRIETQGDGRPTSFKRFL